MMNKDHHQHASPSTGLLPMKTVVGEVRKEFLHPGQMCVSSTPCTVTTIVGSCVALCIWDPIGRIGGVTHYILAQGDGVGQASCRYGDVAVETLITKMGRLGSSPRMMQAHIFGGACMFESFRNSERPLGTMNVEIALEVLGKHGVKILTQQVLGSRGRKVVFQTSDGTFTVKEI
jgi:chemotaxis protein CheD